MTVNTFWTQNGAATAPTVMRLGMGLVFGRGVVVGAPLPIFNANVSFTTWTRTSPLPDGS